MSLYLLAFPITRELDGHTDDEVQKKTSARTF